MVSLNEDIIWEEFVKNYANTRTGLDEAYQASLKKLLAPDINRV